MKIRNKTRKKRDNANIHYISILSHKEKHLKVSLPLGLQTKMIADSSLLNNI